ncbi:MAG: putative YaiI/YqxD family [Chloroflexota bacterium]|jgi:hypothetical protein|nr:hypothetical protein [Candidatus Aquidulcis sp.]
MVDQERITLRNATRLLVDGNNLVGGRDEGRLSTLQATLRRTIALGVAIEVFRDGGARSADDQIVDAIGRPDPGSADRIVVITDDRGLAARCTALGASVVSARFIRDVIGDSARTPLAGTGRRPPSIGGTGPRRTALESNEGDAERRWRPGRGATQKRGPATRPPRPR